MDPGWAAILIFFFFFIQSLYEYNIKRVQSVLDEDAIWDII